MSRPFRLGLIVNPVAGMGGRVGLKGTDGLSEQARKLGAEPLSEARTLRALHRLGAVRQGIAIIAAGGKMGADVATEAGLLCHVATNPAGDETSATDTAAAAQTMMAAQVDLVLFAGGDGTARDIFAVTGDAVPILGIPTGVKMQSAIFATSPEASGDLLAAILALPDRGRLQYRASEVMDIDEEELRRGSISPRLFGYAKVPYIPLLLQNAKVRNHGLDEAALDSAARRIAAEMEPDVVYAIGPGRSAKRILSALNLSGSLLGTDLVTGGKIIARDVNERAILVAARDRTLRIIVGVIGGQGHVFGRGNQELSPAVIRLAGRTGITIIASQQKLLALEDRRLLVDTGDLALDRELAGYWRVVVGPQEDMVMQVAAP
ncbi:MAG TPA: ATP-NAD kinase family protein [Dongiaceae bacterium]|nr:ATP-NAD kinase family protein [Dongiaceae bacterium]